MSSIPSIPNGEVDEPPTPAAVAPDGFPVVDRHVPPGGRTASANRLRNSWVALSRRGFGRRLPQFLATACWAWLDRAGRDRGGGLPGVGVAFRDLVTV